MAFSRLRRTTAQKKALLRDLVTELIIHEHIQTTEAKAKELKKVADKMVTLGKKGTLAARRQAAKTVRPRKVSETQTVLQKLFDEIAPRFVDRPGGYTRVYKIMPRKGDNAPMAIIEFVE
ncbi:MAG: 50S ribosomal protein L17 [Acholeplasmataceae bacterium]|jgi:large subunit ribosomal protein L17|nr:50S ribosomal protein L17 [Acholeplasmataceae bacterium]